MLNRIAGNLRTPMYASVSLTFALMGDAFLYSFLPINAASVYLPAVWIGTILSINRFSRILLNPLILHVFSLVGFRTPTIIAAVTAVLTTASYGLGFGVAAWVALRILWGICYSVLRISALTYALDHPKKGFSLGLSQSIVESGPLLALLAGPVILGLSSPAVTFSAIAFFSLPGVFFATRLAEREVRTSRPPYFKLSRPSVFNALAFMSAFSIEGMLIVLMGVLLLNSQPSFSLVEITALVAGFLSFRRICSILISPFAGWLADRYGLTNVYCGSIFLICVGLLLASAGFVMTGLVVVFTFYNINSSLAAGGASQGQADITHAVSQNATFRDAGSAFGALAGGFMLASSHLDLIFAFCSLLLLGLGLVYYRRA